MKIVISDNDHVNLAQEEAVRFATGEKILYPVNQI